MHDSVLTRSVEDDGVVDACERTGMTNIEDAFIAAVGGNINSDSSWYTTS